MQAESPPILPLASQRARQGTSRTCFTRSQHPPHKPRTDPATMKLFVSLLVGLALANVSAQSSTTGSVGGGSVETVGSTGSGTGSFESVGVAGSMSSSGSLEMNGDVGLSDSGSESVGSDESGSEDYSIQSDSSSAEDESGSEEASESESDAADSQTSAASSSEDNAGVSVRMPALLVSAASTVVATVVLALF